jgi:hypothetical protein
MGNNNFGDASILSRSLIEQSIRVGRMAIRIVPKVHTVLYVVQSYSVHLFSRHRNQLVAAESG